VSASDEGWIPVRDLVEMVSGRERVRVLAFDSRRYVGAQIGIHNLRGEKVGRVGRTRNTEYLIVAGPAGDVARMSAGYPIQRKTG
jgi:adenine-specific DNA-methyltransferase